MEDLRLRCADMKAEAATAQEQVAPLAARVKELEEELTQVASDRDTFRSWAEEAMASAKALAGQLGAKQGAHLLAKGALAEALMVAEASQTKAVVWKGKVEGESCSPCFICFSCVRPITPRCDAELEKEASRVAEASWVKVQSWKEKAEGESCRRAPLFGLFPFVLNPILLVLA